MKDLHSYFENPFGEPSYGLGKLMAFTAHHLVSLRENNAGGIYDGRIAATGAALAAVHSAGADDDTHLGKRKASKQVKRAFRKSLPASIGTIALALTVKYGERSPMLKTFFPSGRSLFFKCRDDILEAELGVLVDALTAHQSELGPDLLAAAEDLQTRWRAVYADSESSTGDKAASIHAKKSARVALEMELFRNLLALAQQFAGEPEKLDVFMQQSLLTRHRPKKHQPAPV